MTTIPIWNPQWTTEVRIEGGGRYPLGLNRFHDHMEEILIKSITWNASRLRHFSYSCWAIGDIARSGLSTNWSDFLPAFQRRETALLTGLYLMQPEYSVPGKDRISARCSTGAASCDCSYSVMKSKDLGAFGLYYTGTTYNLGLTETNESGALVLTPEGKKLYRQLEKRFKNGNPDYYRLYRGKAKVPTDVLQAWGEINDYGNIREDDCLDERAFYKSHIFRLEQTAEGDYRRDTFAFFLYCIDFCVEHNTTFNEDVLRYFHYYGHYFDDPGALRPFEIPKHFEDVLFYCAIYEGHVYFRSWLSEYFQTFLDYLKVQSDGATLDDFFKTLSADEFNEAIAYFLEVEDDWLDKSFSELADQFGGPTVLAEPFSEEMVDVDTAHLTAAGMLAKFTLIMVGLWSKFQPLRRDRRYQHIAVDLGDDLWFDILFQMPRLHNMPIRDFLRKILKSYILDQHDRIMIEKNDLRRCWFTTEKNRYFFEADVSIIPRPAKYGTIMNYLHDMNLIEYYGDDQVRLTGEGRQFYQKIEEEFFGDG